MPAPQAHLDLADTAELAELLTFISQWLGGTDHVQLAASFGRFIGTPAPAQRGPVASAVRSGLLHLPDDGEPSVPFAPSDDVPHNPEYKC
jgi:hypothetical protein